MSNGRKRKIKINRMEETTVEFDGAFLIIRQFDPQEEPQTIFVPQEFYRAFQMLLAQVMEA